VKERNAHDDHNYTGLLMKQQIGPKHGGTSDFASSKGTDRKCVRGFTKSEPENSGQIVTNVVAGVHGAPTRGEQEDVAGSGHQGTAGGRGKS